MTHCSGSSWLDVDIINGLVYWGYVGDILVIWHTSDILVISKFSLLLMEGRWWQESHLRHKAFCFCQCQLSSRRSSHIWTVDVLVMYWWYTGDILVVCWWYTGDILSNCPRAEGSCSSSSRCSSRASPLMLSITSLAQCTIRRLHRGERLRARLMRNTFLKHWWYTGDILIYWWYAADILVIYWWYTGEYWWYTGDILMINWWYTGDILVIHWWYTYYYN